MAKSFSVLLILAVQSTSTYGAFVGIHQASTKSESNLRTKSDSASALSFSQSIWNNTMVNFAQREIEMTKAAPPKVNKIMYVVFAMFFGICGCDRCFMGQICLGCVKGLTGGGFLIWHILDYFTCLANALSKDDKIDMMGYHATFEKGSIEMAFYVALCVFLMQMVQQCNALQGVKAQQAMQQEQQEKLMASMMAAQQKMDAKSDEKEDLDIPRRHQSLAYMPTALTRNLRKAGLVAEKPTIPELIAAFDQMDKDGDGQLDPDEIKEGMAAMGASEETVAEMIKSADTDGDGKISKNEFLISMTQSEQK